MKRLVFYILKTLAFISRIFRARYLYMNILCTAHKSQGVKFVGKPEYIQSDALLDPSGGLTIHNGAVISTRVIILTHDWSFLKRDSNKECISPAFKTVTIGENSFIGAGSIILPGSKIGSHCIIGAGAVVKGTIEDYSIVVGNPCKVIGDTRK